MSFLITKIQEYVNLYGIINPEYKDYFKKIKQSQLICQQREKYLENLEESEQNYLKK